ncbi:MAG: sn-glycerol-3-phosphate ABC transporter ATP-binding protein UgpC [Deltaproteobacteria bacterium]|nr:sn-glycerol-3-phosphate ABC transporter ATP-binding protein UgpC [Deltaproteobacteria bacterium]
MANVTLEKVVKRYGDNEVVKSIDLEIPDQELVVLVGPSGCGKSTTLRMIAGLEDITGGEIRIDGKRVNETAPKDRDIAMVFQSYALYPHMTVRENLEFGLRMRRAPAKEISERVEEAASMLSIEELLSRRPKQLSGGQRQRVAMGRAIVRRPKVFLFDEPLSNLDAKLRAQMRLELARLHARLRTTMVYVTHDQVEAMTLADRIVVMNEGVIQQVGSPLELYQHPTNRFVAGFLGTPAMNFVSGQLSSTAGEVSFTAEGLQIALEDHGSKLESPEAKEVVLGVRPPDIKLSPDDPSPTPGMVRAKVEVREPMGAEIFLHLDSTCGALVARVDSDCDYRAGDAVMLSIPNRAVHLFDAASHQNLLF